MFEYLSEIETELEITLACLSDPRWVRTRKKTEGQKSRWTVPLTIKVP